MTALHQWQDEHGSYELILCKNYIESKIVGVIGEDITERFNRDISAMAMSFSGRPFGYLANLTGSKSISKKAQDIIIRSYKSCIAYGCVIDAMIIDSSLVKSQMQFVNDEVDIPIPFEIRVFKEHQKAAAFIQKIVKKATDA